MWKNFKESKVKKLKKQNFDSQRVTVKQFNMCLNCNI